MCQGMGIFDNHKSIAKEQELFRDEVTG